MIACAGQTTSVKYNEKNDLKISDFNVWNMNMNMNESLIIKLIVIWI